MAKVAVIIAAAGKGDRFGGKEKKTFAKLDGRPLFLRSIELFVNREDVCRTILVVAPEDMEEVKRRYAANLGFMGVQVVEGGDQRYKSVALAIEKVPDEADLVAVHDAVRVCVTEAMIDAVFAEAVKTGAAILGAPLVGTIKRVSDAGVIDETVDRAGLVEVQTPQVFKRQVILDAYAKLEEFKGEPTDDAELVEAIGHPVAVIESDRTNIKVTTQSDMTLAAAIFRARPKPKPKGPRGPFEEAQW